MEFDPGVLTHNFDTALTILEDVSILLGLAMLFSAAFQFKRYGEMRTFMSHQMTLGRPMMLLLGSMFFMMMPFFLRVVLTSIWGNDTSPLAYHATEGWEQLMPPLLLFVRIIGVVSIMRGITYLARTGAIGHQPGTAGRALIHLVAGAMMVHIIGTYDLLTQFMGYIG
ncbi:MAG: type IV secretion protein IcmC [Gammaproteobacteria bacterium]|nr:type IV secretion protein IcmC [Gammaproteobacteria bacterium]